MKTLPHRLRDGRCRDCGQHDSYSAPDTCARCALDRMKDRGYGVVWNPVEQFDRGAEMWRQPAAAIRSGAIQSGRFYIMIGHNDGGSLELPPGEPGFEAGGWATPQARSAQAMAEFLLENRYPQAWIVTTVGCWNAARHTIQEER